ncbi:hypothetical protein WJT74_04420 [Sphingomicrobium sp. XHP0239]
MTRDLADFVHLLCFLHGRHPTLIETALTRVKQGPQRDWVLRAGDAFEAERLALVGLVSQVGPIPSTPGAAATETVVQAQRHAIETLAASERDGCALGAAVALVTDWVPFRALLDMVAARLSVDVPRRKLPDAAHQEALVATVDGPGAQRAFNFGLDQLLTQHRGLFDLLEARASARNALDGLA